MTSKGIGWLIKINEDKAKIWFGKSNKKEYFLLREISNNFYCFIYIYSSGIKIIRLKLKVLGKIDDIFEELEKIKKLNKNENNCSLIYKGISLKKIIHLSI